ncbi:MAG: hypothetical protein SPE79_03825, partial [Sodaliphilus sp.]|nr:hypothetical protein [Sodaliphilus sp.]
VRSNIAATADTHLNNFLISLISWNSNLKIDGDKKRNSVPPVLPEEDAVSEILFSLCVSIHCEDLF